MTTEDDTIGNFGRLFWKYLLFCNALKKSAKICLRAREPDAVLKRATFGSRVIGSRPLIYGLCIKNMLWNVLEIFRSFAKGRNDR